MAKANPITDATIYQKFSWRFWKYVRIGGMNECWPWTGEITGPGYGRFRIGKHSTGAHRVAYVLVRGPIQNLACHHCDNKLCCNPLHLFDGDYLENARDMCNKGRHVPRKPLWTPDQEKPFQRKRAARVWGERANFAKLNPELVTKLRADFARGDGFHVLADRYGISGTAAANIVKRRAWKQVP
jgi:hypothetical protein